MYKNLIKMYGMILALLMSSTVSATIISSFDAGAEVTISADFDILNLEAYLDDEELLEIDGTGNASGSGDVSLNLTAGSTTKLNAFAGGEIQSQPAFVGSLYLSSGEFFFDNNTASDITGTVTFYLSYFANIFTDSAEEYALSYSSIFIDFIHFDENDVKVDNDILFDEILEFDSDYDGIGSFGNTNSTQVTKTLTIGADHYVSYYVEFNAAGIAESTIPVPEPSTLVILVLGVMGLSFRKINNASPR
jgi:hypothetical protein